jgi:hypothetical protein
MSEQIKVSTVTSALDTVPRDYDASRVIQSIRTGGNELRGRGELIRETSERELAMHGDAKRAKVAAGELKKQLPAVLWSGTFTKRTNDGLVQHSGLLCADLDSLNGSLADVKGKLSDSPYLWAVFTSPSGDGLKAVFRVYPDTARHAGSFRAVEQHVRDLTGVQIDKACKDPARLCFFSSDPELFHNANARAIEPLPEPENPKPLCSGDIPADLPLRERIATEVLGPLMWSAEKGGYFCKCPGEGSHTNGSAKKHTIVYLNGSPTLACQHTSCRGIVEAFNAQLRSLIGKAERAEVQKSINPSRGQLVQESATTGRTGAANGHSGRQYAFSDLSKISAKAVEWIEEPYLARGEMHFLQGQGGSYKGTLALTWAAEFSRRAENVLLVLAEDDLARKVKPLLMAAQADMRFIHPLTIRQGENEDALVLPDDLNQLERAMAEAQAALVVIDPLLSHVSPSVDAYKDQHVKRGLTQIGKIAQRMNTAIVCVHHTKKDTSAGMKMAGMGSVAFYTTARVVLAMAKLSEDEVVLEVVKSNICPEGVKQLLRADIVDPMPGIKCPRLTRVGESLVGVAEALSCERKEKETKALGGAKLILDILEREGEQKQSALFDRVAEETESSLKTIRNKAYFGIIKPGEAGLGLVEVRKDQYQGELMIRRTNVSRPPKLQTVTSNCNLQSYTQENGYTLGFSQVTDYSSKVTHCVPTPNCNRVTPREEIGYTLNGDKAVSAISVTTEPVPPEGMTIEDGQPNRSDELIEEAVCLFNAVSSGDPEGHCRKIEHAS